MLFMLIDDEGKPCCEYKGNVIHHEAPYWPLKLAFSEYVYDLPGFEGRLYYRTNYLNHRYLWSREFVVVCPD